MKPIRRQFVDALGYKGKSPAYFRTFALIVTAGFAVLFGEIFGTEAYSGGSPFDLKVAVGSFALAGLCILLAANRIVALSTAIMIPGVLVARHAFIKNDRKAQAFYLGSLAVGFLVMAAAVLTQSFWRHRSSRPRE